MKIFPIFMAIFSYSMPAGLVVYWLASNLWTIGQQEILFRTMPKNAAVIDVDAVEVDPKIDKAAAKKTESAKKPVAAKALASPKASAPKVSASPKPGAGTKSKAGPAAGNPPASGSNGSSVGVGSSGAPQGSRPAKPQATKRKGR